MASDTLRNVYVSALQNAHALEQQALQIMERQVERLEHYPEVEQALRRHITETQQQRQRLEEALDAIGESNSTLKDAFMGFMGNMAALAHTPAQDEILKNTFANHAFENYEIATYKSLITVAQATGFAQTTAFEQSLREEQAMAQWIFDNVEGVTRAYLARTGRGADADI